MVPLTNRLRLVASLAAYVNATAHLRKRDPLLFAEAWGYFQDVLLLILTSEFEGPEEPLSLLVAPFICGAMQTLLRHSDASTSTFLQHHPRTRPSENVRRKILCLVSLDFLPSEVPEESQKHRG